MIIAKTQMTEMPIRCGACNYYFTKGLAWGKCHILGVSVELYQDRPKYCPLMTLETMTIEDAKGDE